MEHLRLPVARLSFPRFVEEKDDNGKMKTFNCCLVFKSDVDISAIKKQIKAAAAEKFGKDFPSDKLKIAFKKGSHFKDDEGVLWDGFEEDSQVIQASFRKPMVFLDKDKSPISSNAQNIDEIFYGGCYVIPIVSAYAYEGTDGGTKYRGVNVQLENMMKWEDGESFGAKQADPNAAFADMDAPEGPRDDTDFM